MDLLIDLVNSLVLLGLLPVSQLVVGEARGKIGAKDLICGDGTTAKTSCALVLYVCGLEQKGEVVLGVLANRGDRRASIPNCLLRL